MAEKKKELYDYKLGEDCPDNLMNGLMKAPNKLVKIAYTFQSRDGVQMTAALVHKDYIEDDDE